MADNAQATFQQLYEKCQSMVRSVAFRMVGLDGLDDVVQETFMKIWKAHNTFSGQAQFKTWVYRVAVNSAIDYLRRQKRRALMIVDADVDQQATPTNDLVAKRDLVQKGLQRLSIAHRTVLVLFSLEGLTIDEIATVLETAPGTVKSRLHHARKNMQEFLQAQGMDV